MKRALRHRLLHRPRFPPSLAAAAPGALLAQEGVSVKVSATNVRAPGLRISRSVRLVAGSLVVRPEGTLAAVGRNLLLAPDGPPRATLRFAEDGLHIVIDLARAIESAKGAIEVVYRGPIDPAVLAAVGTDERPVALAPGVRLRQLLGGGNVAAA